MSGIDEGRQDKPGEACFLLYPNNAGWLYARPEARFAGCPILFTASFHIISIDSLERCAVNSDRLKSRFFVKDPIKKTRFGPIRISEPS